MWCWNTASAGESAEPACQPALGLPAPCTKPGEPSSRRIRWEDWTVLDFRCARCAKLLARAKGADRIEIKCPRCGAINTLLRAARPESESLRAPDRDARDER